MTACILGGLQRYYKKRGRLDLLGLPNLNPKSKTSSNMNTLKQAYMAIDLHNNNSVIGCINQEGEVQGLQQVKTQPQTLITQITGVSAERKYLTIEQTNATFAMAEKLSPYVDKLIICEPRHNKLISQNSNKNDSLDALNLCRLLRLGELKPVWRPKQMGKRRLFYQQVKEYYRLTKALTRNKNQLQASLRHWGLNITLSPGHYRDPSGVVDSISNRGLAEQLAAKMQWVGFLEGRKDDQLKRIKDTGSDFWEVAEFQKMRGIGPVGAHTFSAYIQTPQRFSSRKQLIRFCQLAVCKRSSDGKQVGREHLDKAGHSCLKQVSYIAWEVAQKSDNEVSRFYQASLKRSANATNARLNTQRKILTILWSLWKHKRTYRPGKFYAGDGNSVQ